MQSKLHIKQKLAKNIKVDIDRIWLELMNGSQAALSKLYRFSRRWLFRCGYRIVPREAFIKDKIQDYF